MPKTTQVTLGGRTYTIKEAFSGPATAWRDRADNSRTMRIFQSLEITTKQLAQAISAVVPDKDGKRDWKNIEIDKVISVTELAPILINSLSGSMNEIIELLYAYSPELAADREWIEANAYDSEMVSAFCEVLKLAYPFLELLALIPGAKALLTSSNSPTANGATGQRRLARQK